MPLPLVKGDSVIDRRTRRVIADPDNPSEPRYDGPVGEVITADEGGFRVSWPAWESQGPYSMGYAWEFMELGIRPYPERSL